MNYRRHIKQPQYISKIFGYTLSRPWKAYWFVLLILFIFIQYTFLIWMLPIYGRLGGKAFKFLASIVVFPGGMVYICEKLKLDGKHIFDYLKDMFIFFKDIVIGRKCIYGYEVVRRKKKHFRVCMKKWGEDTV